jgi:hypothetical protein
VKKLFYTFVKQTNKSTWQREKGKVGDNTRQIMNGGETGKDAVSKKWEIYSTVTMNPAGAEPNDNLPFVRLLWSKIFTYDK